jgi:peroxiredoxin
VKRVTGSVRVRQYFVSGAVVLLAMSVLTGCSSDPLAEQYREGSNKQYIAGDGTVTEIAEQNRGNPISFVGTTETGQAISSADYLGTVLVLNFWYAGCGPCRAEATELQKLNEKYEGLGASFLGVNIRDQAATASAFEKTFGVTYPSVIDTDGAVQLALSGDFAPAATPTTLVIDKQGRVAARILGQVTEPSILDTLIHDAVAGVS